MLTFRLPANLPTTPSREPLRREELTNLDHRTRAETINLETTSLETLSQVTLSLDRRIRVATTSLAITPVNQVAISLAITPVNQVATSLGTTPVNQVATSLEFLAKGPMLSQGLPSFPP
jgi:hypothetical protein